VKVNGCSGNVKVSNSNFAGTTLPLLSESIPKVADIVVSKSEAERLIHYGLNQIKVI
jgi:hypothetical protein